MQIGSHLRLSNYNPGLVTQKCASGNYDLSSGGFHQAYGRFSPPLDRESQTLRQRASINIGASRGKRNRRAADDMCNVVKSEQINGYRGTDPLESLLQFIEGRKQVQRLSGKSTSANEAHVNNNSIIENPNSEENGINSNCAKKKTKVKKEKAKKASSIGTSCDAADVEEEIMNTRARSTLENMRFLCKSDEFQTSIGSNETTATSTQRKIIPMTKVSVSNFKLQGTVTIGGGATTSKDFSSTEIFMNNVDKKFNEISYELQFENGREMEEASFITVTSKKQKKSDNRQKKATLTQQQPKCFPAAAASTKKFLPRNAVPSSTTTTPLVMRHSPSAVEYLDASTSSKMNCNNAISTNIIWPSITVGKNTNPPLMSAETTSQEKTFTAIAPTQRRFSCPPVEFLDRKENHVEIINMTNALGGLTFGCFDDEDESGSDTVINCNNSVHISNNVVTNDIKTNERVRKSTTCQTDDLNVKSDDSTELELNDRVKSKGVSDNRLINDMANFVRERWCDFVDGSTNMVWYTE
uniref:Uncharacterized protein n=1 Tax=Romanomermis culicivorax TaxID=13658 RepID=A0A915KUZ9_ROMCU